MRGSSVVVRSDQKSARDLPCDRHIKQGGKQVPYRHVPGGIGKYSMKEACGLQPCHPQPYLLLLCGERLLEDRELPLKDNADPV